MVQKIPFEAEALKEWFQKVRRSFPWRESPSPYAVWISEVMLQQTQASVVVGYFRRWMERFPTIEALSRAEESEVIKLWEGLGYYSRARYLHAAAQHLVLHHGGELPSSREALAEIQGIGAYTVGALLSFAFRQKAAAVDGNAIRVLTRYFAIWEDVQEAKTKKEIWQVAEGILPDEEPWVVVEGLIELGALVCRKDPDCAECPIREGCAARKLGIQGELPKKGRRIEVTQLARSVFVIVEGENILVKKGKKGEIMADLFEFPYAPLGEIAPFPLEKQGDLTPVQHTFTRYRVKLFPAFWKPLERISHPDYDWIPWSEGLKLPFSSGHRKILREVHAHLTHGEF
ncbi:MAG: A/G-specific adenine glycosylase [Verrucomicrobia bacterium]|nr:A/G-specific adenine glycosylase [Verrucomicrobiota bacterium]